PPFTASEDLRRAERLTEETLDSARAKHNLFVLRRQLVHAENRDDVLEILEALQYFLDSPRDVVVFLTDDLRRERARRGRERIHGRVDAQFGDGALQHDGGI